MRWDACSKHLIVVIISVALRLSDIEICMFIYIVGVSRNLFYYSHIEFLDAGRARFYEIRGISRQLYIIYDRIKMVS